MNQQITDKLIRLPLQLNILLVEDNPADAKYVRFALANLVEPSYQVHHRRSLSTAIDYLGEHAAQLILLDLNLADGKGLSCLDSLRQCRPDIPVLVLTGLNDKSLALEAVQRGAQDYLIKQNINPEALSRCIRYAIERNRLQKRLYESQLLFQKLSRERELILNSVGEGIIGTNNNGLIKFVNPAAEQMLGWQTGELTGKPLHAVLHSPMHGCKKQDCHFAALIEKMVSDFDVNDTFQRKNGLPLPVEYTSTPIKDDDKMVGVVLAFKDVTERRLAQESAQRLLLLEQREDFMATLTHDLKNPLIGTIRILELLAEGQFGELKDEQREILKQLETTNHSLLNLIQDLSEVYRYEKSAESLRFETVQLAEILDECLHEVEPLAKSKHLQVQTNKHSLPVLLADRRAIKRVWQNLLDNAIKFAPPSGFISLNLSGNNGSCIFEIQNDGPGIAVEDQGRLFQRFWQGSPGRKYAPGTGLGLYLCKKIIDSHGGTIDCLSSEAGPTSFIIRLPVAA